jgi:hypothetical protein
MPKPQYVDAEVRHAEYLERQRQRIKHIRLTPEMYARVERYAADNGMSVSNAIREVIAKYVDGLPVVGRRSRSRRVALWIEPETWHAFAEKAQGEGLTMVAALEAAMEEVL